MEPRAKSSLKWSRFPAEVNEVILDLIDREYGAYKTRGKFIVEGFIYPEEIVLRVGFLPTGQIQQANFECSVDFAGGKQKVVDRIQLAFEASSSMMDVYFEQKTTDFPIEWSPYDLNEETVYVRHSTFNSDLEAQADALLGEGEKQLIHQTEDSEIDELITTLGIDDTKSSKTVH